MFGFPPGGWKGGKEEGSAASHPSSVRARAFFFGGGGGFIHVANTVGTMYVDVCADKLLQIMYVSGLLLLASS